MFKPFSIIPYCVRSDIITLYIFTPILEPRCDCHSPTSINSTIFTSAYQLWHSCNFRKYLFTDFLVCLLTNPSVYNPSFRWHIPKPSSLPFKSFPVKSNSLLLCKHKEFYTVYYYSISLTILKPPKYL